jgi:hypothetical protein
VHTAHDVVSENVAIGHERTSVHAPPVQHAVTLTIGPSNEDKINVRNQRMNKPSGVKR